MFFRLHALRMFLRIDSVLLICFKKMRMTIVEASLQHHATRSLPIHGITIATGDSSFTSLLSFITVSVATSPLSLMESRYCCCNRARSER